MEVGQPPQLTAGDLNRFGSNPVQRGVLLYDSSDVG